MTRQVEQLFGTAPDDIETYALESQISQAEAMKFFIEHFRIGKWYRSGIIWWNIIDGWPQISDAVVDWYGVKKLAYEYIKRSQRMFCLMCDEPDQDGNIALFAANDYAFPVEFKYTLRDALNGEAVLSGKAVSSADSSEKITLIRENMPRYCVIEWRITTPQGESGSALELDGRNHFIRNLENRIDLDSYRKFMKFAGLSDSINGFSKY
jgi:beta-mannosidase